MRKYRIGLLAFTLRSIATLAAANAADLNAPGGYKDSPIPYVSWTGFYVGADVGGVTGGATPKLVDFSSDGYDKGPALNTSDGSSVIGGVHIGYNWELGGGYKDGLALSHFVLGVEGDFDWTDLHRGQNGILLAGGAPFGNSTFSEKDNTHWLASVRARLGYAMGAFMPYVTGGAAWNETNYSGFVTNNVAAGGGPGGFNTTRTESGWVLGGGIEYNIAPHWNLRGEYLHYDFGGDITFVGAHNPTFVPGAAGRFTYNRSTDDVARVGVSYKFGGWGIDPLK